MKLKCMKCKRIIQSGEQYVGFPSPTPRRFKVMCIPCYKGRGRDPSKIRTRVDGGLGQYKHQSPFPVPGHPRPMPLPGPIGPGERRFMTNSNGDKEEGYSEHEDPFTQEEEEEYEGEEPERLPMDESTRKYLGSIRERMQKEEEAEVKRLMQEGIIQPEIDEEEEQEPEGGWPTIEKVEEEIFGEAKSMTSEAVEETARPVLPTELIKAEEDISEFAGLPEHRRRFKEVQKKQEEYQPEWDELQLEKKQARQTVIPEELWDQASEDPRNIGGGWVCIGRKNSEYYAHQLAEGFEQQGYLVGVLPTNVGRIDITEGTGPEKRGIMWGVFIYDPEHKVGEGLDVGPMVTHAKKRPIIMENNPKGGKRKTEREGKYIGKSRLSWLSPGMKYKIRDLMIQTNKEWKQIEVRCPRCNKEGKELDEDPKIGIDPPTLKKDPESGEVYINEKTGRAMGKVCPECKGEGFYIKEIIPQLSVMYGPHLLQAGEGGIEIWGPRKGDKNPNMIHLDNVVKYETLSEIERQLKELEEYREFKGERKKIPLSTRRLCHSLVPSEEPSNLYEFIGAGESVTLDILAKYRCVTCNKEGRIKADDPRVGIDPSTIKVDEKTGKIDLTITRVCPTCNGSGFGLYSTSDMPPGVKPEYRTERAVGYIKTLTEVTGKTLVPNVLLVDGTYLHVGPPQEHLVGVLTWLFNVAKVPRTVTLVKKYEDAMLRLSHPPRKGESKISMFGYFYHSSKPVEYSIEEFWKNKGAELLAQYITVDEEDILHWCESAWSDLPEELRNKFESKVSLRVVTENHFPQESDDAYWKAHAKEILNLLIGAGHLLNVDKEKEDRIAGMDWKLVPAEVKKVFSEHRSGLYAAIPLKPYGFLAWWNELSRDSKIEHIISVVGFSREESDKLQNTPYNDLPDDIKEMALEGYNSYPKEIYYNFYIETFMGRIQVMCDVRHPIYGTVQYSTPYEVRYINQALQLFASDVYDEHGNLRTNSKLATLYPGALEEGAKAIQILEGEMDKWKARLDEQVEEIARTDPNLKTVPLDSAISYIWRHARDYKLPIEIVSYLIAKSIKGELGVPGLDLQIRKMLREKKIEIKEEAKKEREPRGPRKPGEKRAPREGKRVKTETIVETIPVSFDEPVVSPAPPKPVEQPKPTGTEKNPVVESILMGVAAGIASGAAAGLVSGAKSNPKKKRKGPAKGSPEAKAKMARIRALKGKKNINEVM